MIHITVENRIDNEVMSIEYLFNPNIFFGLRPNLIKSVESIKEKSKVFKFS